MRNPNLGKKCEPSHKMRAQVFASINLDKILHLNNRVLGPAFPFVSEATPTQISKIQPKCKLWTKGVLGLPPKNFLNIGKDKPIPSFYLCTLVGQCFF